jgi:hypothetical protein
MDFLAWFFSWCRVICFSQQFFPHRFSLSLFARSQFTRQAPPGFYPRLVSSNQSAACAAVCAPPGIFLLAFLLAEGAPKDPHSQCVWLLWLCSGCGSLLHWFAPTFHFSQSSWGISCVKSSALLLYFSSSSSLVPVAARQGVVWKSLCASKSKSAGFAIACGFLQV